LAWNRAGIIQGATDKKLDPSAGNCTTFAYGTEKQCLLSYTASSFGVVIFLLFCASSGISILYTLKSRKHPEAEDPWLSPESKQAYAATPGGLETGRASASKDPIWDANTRELDGHNDEESDDGTRTERGGDQGQDEYALLHSTDTDEGRHPGNPVHWGPLGSHPTGMAQQPHIDTEYRGAQTYQAPSALSPDGYHVDSPSMTRPSPIEYSPEQDSRGRQGGGGRYTFSQPQGKP